MNEADSAEVTRQVMLKNLFISQARAVYGSEMENAHTFDVIIHKVQKEDAAEVEDCGVLLICHRRSNSFSKARLILNGGQSHSARPSDGMWDLYQHLQDVDVNVLRLNAEAEVFSKH
jgi:hypothetical protein